MKQNGQFRASLGYMMSFFFLSKEGETKWGGEEKGIRGEDGKGKGEEGQDHPHSSDAQSWSSGSICLLN